MALLLWYWHALKGNTDDFPIIHASHTVDALLAAVGARRARISGESEISNGRACRSDESDRPSH